MQPGSSKHKEYPIESSPNTARPYSKVAAKEIRRNRGEIACAECRRLKVRCNRQVPCSTCISRGCTALCPNGVLPPGDNSRFVVAAKDHLQKKISKMEERMRALEDALAIAQAAESTQPHPLLTTPLRFEDEKDLDSTPQQEDPVKPVIEDELSDSFGTLHIDDREKTMRFFGPSGGAESLLINEHESAEVTRPDLHEDIGPLDLRALGLPIELDMFFESFPLAPIGIPVDPVREIIESFLPPWERAESLCRILLQHLSWMFQIVSYQQVTQELMAPIYSRTSRSHPYDPHDLALLLAVLAVGSLVDLSLPAYNEDAQRYYVLSRSSLALYPLMEGASLSTIKTLHLISIYNGMSGKESNLANTYTVLNLAGRLAQRMGLHIDPGNWGLKGKDAYDRRCYFWNLLQGDMWQSLGTGRPPALADLYSNCKVPTELEEREYQQHEHAALGFGVWGFRLSRECVIPIIRIVLASGSPSYQLVIDLDQKIRSIAMPDGGDSPDSPSVAISMRWWVRSHYIELMLLSLHRGFFAQAIASYPTNPFDSPYKHSFVTAYKCACRVLDVTSEQFVRQPKLLSRVWMVWSFSFVSAVIVGAVASRAKHLDIDPPPLDSFNRACTLFQSASKVNSRAARALSVLLDMRERAMQLHYPSTEHRAAPAKDDDVAALRGKPRLVESTAQPHPVPPTAASGMPSTSFAAAGPSTSAPAYPSSLHTAVPPLESNWHSGYSEPPVHQYHEQTLDPMPTVDESWVAPHPSYPESHSADFILDDTWSNFMQHYGSLGPSGH